MRHERPRIHEADLGLALGALASRADIKTLSHAVLVFNDGSQIVAEGVFGFNGDDVRIGVTGGTGTYEGARGTVVSHSNADDSSTDTITLLP